MVQAADCSGMSLGSGPGQERENYGIGGPQKLRGPRVIANSRVPVTFLLTTG